MPRISDIDVFTSRFIGYLIARREFRFDIRTRISRDRLFSGDSNDFKSVVSIASERLTMPDRAENKIFFNWKLLFYLEQNRGKDN